MDNYFHIFFFFVTSSLFIVTHFIKILVSFHFFNKKLLNIVIYDHVSTNPHVYNLLYGIFTIINTIVGNVISLCKTREKFNFSEKR